LKETEEFWSEWSARCKYSGPWREPVVRSLITLKALTYHPTGGIVAAPTASLPECPGGSRNWNYRYCWLRDATFTLLALMHAGYRDEAEAWRAWLVRTVAGLPSQLQPVYSVMGHRCLAERELSWLPGYAGATPVHAGNDAYGQLQIDTFGEVLDALHHARCHDLGTMLIRLLDKMKRSMISLTRPILSGLIVRIEPWRPWISWRRNGP
jgi:GH15 family glucan-1,4-alpha-glucosidase